MYVTRPLSTYRRSPSTLSIPAPAAPYSGYLVISDEEAEAEDAYCWGLCQHKRVERLPFPQDKILTITHPSEYQDTSSIKVLFIPVPDHPLSANRYYVIRAQGKYKGKACKCSREGDIINCCITDILGDRRPKDFNLKDLYQIFKIHSHLDGGFFARSIAPDGIPPKFLRKKGWRVRISSSNRRSFKLSEALGLDASLRAKLPNFNFPMSRRRSPPMVVGKWYCPFIFVREGKKVKQQMKKSMYYSMTLEQRWEEIFTCESGEIEAGNTLTVNANVQREVVLVSGGMEASKINRIDPNGFFWFTSYNPYDRSRVSVGVSSAIVENMRWVQEAGGWAYGNQRVVRIREEVTRESQWQRFGCYVLVESFCLRRLEGRMVLRYDFRHTDKIKYKWE
ncbi:hypothetical protein L6164_007653 [Bauhinia variegata]|uniref:Uncharacterized protein n=1 Tax=Bauhinia variegata TaxID=167791 RepID=A0ACB9PE31_BAUVA|nr:hypothetical protein L6164_007653 [Bauhinia variegata]